MKRVIRLLLSPFAFLAGLIALVLLLPIAALSIPWTAIAIVRLRFRERKLLKQLIALSRAITWKEAEVHLLSGEGTLIIEQRNKDKVRLWWTPDELLTIAPFPAISSVEQMEHAYITGKSSNPFVPWCYQNYLSTSEGKAFLIDSAELHWPAGPLETTHLKGLYPNAHIVQTLLLDRSN